MEVMDIEQDLIPYGDSWNLPMFLLKDGSLTLMYMASFIVLVMLYASLSTMEKFSTMV